MQWASHDRVAGTKRRLQLHEVHAGGSAMTACSAATLGLTLAEAKEILAGLQREVGRVHQAVHAGGQGAAFEAVAAHGVGLEAGGGGAECRRR